MGACPELRHKRDAHPACPRPGGAGFTLIELLASLGILAIGLGSVLALVWGGTKIGNAASARNEAAIVIPEAIADIERIHVVPSGVGPASFTGYLISTYEKDTSVAWPCIKDAGYQGVQVNLPGNTLGDYINRRDPNGNTMVWPLSANPRYYGGPLNQNTGTSTGTPFRALYRLERHPDWVVNPQFSTFVGMYVLTLTVYRDLSPALHPSSTSKRYEQISDPVVVYLRKGG